MCKGPQNLPEYTTQVDRYIGLEQTSKVCHPSIQKMRRVYYKLTFTIINFPRLSLYFHGWI